MEVRNTFGMVVKVYSDSQYVGSNKVTVQDNNEKVTVSLDQAIQ